MGNSDKGGAAGSGKHGILKTGAWLQAQKRDNREASWAWGPWRGQHTLVGTGKMTGEQLKSQFLGNWWKHSKETEFSRSGVQSETRPLSAQSGSGANMTSSWTTRHHESGLCPDIQLTPSASLPSQSLDFTRTGLCDVAGAAFEFTQQRTKTPGRHTASGSEASCHVAVYSLKSLRTTYCKQKY